MLLQLAADYFINAEDLPTDASAEGLVIELTLADGEDFGRGLWPDTSTQSLEVLTGALFEARVLAGVLGVQSVK